MERISQGEPEGPSAREEIAAERSSHGAALRVRGARPCAASQGQGRYFRRECANNYYYRCACVRARAYAAARSDARTYVEPDKPGCGRRSLHRRGAGENKAPPSVIALAYVAERAKIKGNARYHTPLCRLMRAIMHFSTGIRKVGESGAFISRARFVRDSSPAETKLKARVTRTCVEHDHREADRRRAVKRKKKAKGVFIEVAAEDERDSSSDAQGKYGDGFRT